MRTAIPAAGLMAVVTLVPQPVASPPGPKAERVTLYRVASCQCCGRWADHLRANGFEVTVHVVENRDDAPPRARVPEALRSCHTATVGGYIVEGHVPADVIEELLRRRPRVDGLAVPGMPLGSPGMESPTPEPYEVIAFDAAGRTSVFARR
ncbi:MAG TPA: DUF411 domain-containing protein [Vicinamibacterales bacterium]|nr:DUF411 domain-containing protein [Vicinamibacterales bacterium]